MPYLIYDKDKAEAVVLDTGNGQTKLNVCKPLDMKHEFVPSIMLGDIKKREVYFQGLKAQQKKSGMEASALILAAMAGIIGLCIGVLIGTLMHLGTATTTVTSTVTTTTSATKMLVLLLRGVSR
jgi:hypothetical protein